MEPVEVGAPGRGRTPVALGLARRSELVRAESLRARTVEALRQRQQVERDVEEGEPSRRRGGRAPGVRLRCLQRG